MPRLVELSSAKNPIVQRVRDVARGGEDDLLLVDGFRLVEESVHADLPIVAAAFTDRLTKHKGGWELRRRLEQRAETSYLVKESVFERMSPMKSPQGVLAIVERPANDPQRLLGGTLLGGAEQAALIVAAAEVNDPGNLGAMIRAAEASGASGFAALQGGADPFRDKAVRGSSGSVLRLPIWSGVEIGELLEFVAEHGLQLAVADQTSEADYLAADLKKPTVLVLGNEGQGLPAEILAAATQSVRIPMAEPVESLNVAVATGVLLFEARRQRL